MTLKHLLAACVMIFALPAWAEVKITEVTSPSGIKAWLSQDPEIPFVALEMRFRGGATLDAPEKAGATALMTTLLDEGAGKLDSFAFAEARDSLAARFRFSSSTDWVSVSAQMLSENRDEAAALLASALQEPHLDADATERMRAQTLTSLRAAEKDPNEIASRAFHAMAFGPDHPYGRADGTVQSVSALNRDDLVAAHKAAFSLDNVYIAAAGDISPEDLGLLLDKILVGLPKTQTPAVAQAPWGLQGGTTVIDFPSPQSVVLWADQGISQDDPDFFAAYILNEALGGGFSSRLISEVRSKRGLTYGVGTNLASYEAADILLGQFSASNEKVAEAIAVIQAEWDRIAQEGLSEAELSRIKTYLTGSYPLRFDGNGAKAAILAGMQMQGMPIDYPNTRNAKVEAVTMEDIKRVAARLYQKDRLHFFVVGQPEGVHSTAQ